MLKIISDCYNTCFNIILLSLVMGCGILKNGMRQCIPQSVTYQERDTRGTMLRIDRP